MTEHRIHNHIDELTDKDLRENSGAYEHITQSRETASGEEQIKTQMGMNELMTGNRKNHIRVWKHKEKEDKV